MTELPKGWVEASVADVAKDVSSGFASGRHNSEAIGIPHLRPMNVSRNGEIDMAAVKYVAEAAGDRRLSYGDVLFNNTNSPALVGKTAAFESHEPVAFSNHMTRVRLHDGVVPSFVARQLHHLWISGGLAHLISNHVNQASIASSRLAEDVQLLIAPTAEQARIVTAVEEAFSKLDAGEAGLRTVRQLLKRTREAVLAAAVGGRIVPQDPTDTPTTELLADLGVQPLAKRSLGTLPESWQWASLGDVSAIGGGIQKQPKRAPRVNALPFLRVANVGKGSLDLSEVHAIEVFEGEVSRYGLQRGDLLVVEGNGSPDQIGRAAMWHGEIDPCVHQNHLIRVRPSPALLPAYLELYWNSPEASRRVQAVASSTSGLHTLSTGKLKVLPVAVPPIGEQERIVAEADRQLSFVAACERTVEVGLALSAALRRSVLKGAFEGRLVPQDSSDEPASTLLERIRAERATGGESSGGRRRKKVEAS